MDCRATPLKLLVSEVMRCIAQMLPVSCWPSTPLCVFASLQTWWVLLYGARRVAEGNVGLIYNSTVWYFERLNFFVKVIMRSVIVGGGIWTWLGFELWTNNQVQLMCIGLSWCSVDHTWNWILVWESDPKMAFCRFGNQYLPSLYMTLYVMKSNYQSEQHHKILWTARDPAHSCRATEPRRC